MMWMTKFKMTDGEQKKVMSHDRILCLQYFAVVRTTVVYVAGDGEQ